MRLVPPFFSAPSEYDVVSKRGNFSRLVGRSAVECLPRLLENSGGESLARYNFFFFFFPLPSEVSDSPPVTHPPPRVNWFFFSRTSLIARQIRQVFFCSLGCKRETLQTKKRSYGAIHLLRTINLPSGPGCFKTALGAPLRAEGADVGHLGRRDFPPPLKYRLRLFNDAGGSPMRLMKLIFSTIRVKVTSPRTDS